MDPSLRSEFRFPFELVASIAARLLEGESYQDAARRTVALLDACEAELFKDTVAKQDAVNRFSGTRLQNEALRLYTEECEALLPPAMNFEAGGVYVTGQKRSERALPLFRRFLKHCIRHEKVAVALGKNYFLEEDERYNDQYAATPETTEEELLNRQKELPSPIPGELLHKWRGWFTAWQAREKSERARQKGKRGGRPKNTQSKKSLAGKRRPKS